MAKIADYVQSTDDLDGEIQDAQTKHQARDAETGQFVPERFKGKTAAEVAKSYEELEKLNSRQANDLGQLKAKVDQLLESQIAQPPASPSQVPAAPVTVDELYEDPDASIRRIAKEQTSEEIAAIKKELDMMRQQKIADDLESRFPKWQTVSQSPEFAEWVQDGPYRQALAGAVRSQSDLAAAQELLEMYYDQQKESPSKSKASRPKPSDKELNDAMLETGSATSNAELIDTYSRSELLEQRLAAKAGNLKAQRWLSAHADSITKAYQEGRIVN